MEIQRDLFLLCMQLSCTGSGCKEPCLGSILVIGAVPTGEAKPGLQLQEMPPGPAFPLLAPVFLQLGNLFAQPHAGNPSVTCNLII